MSLACQLQVMVALLFSTVATSRVRGSLCLCIQLSADGESFILLTIYRPGSTRTSSLFYDDLSTVLESLVLQRCPVVVGGDFNIHVEDPTDVDAQRLAAVFNAFDKQQHVMEPTHVWAVH